MANFIDILSLVLTITVFGGVIYGVIIVMNSIKEGMASTKESLKSRGLDVSSKGVSIKTSKRFDREDYVDATQRGIVRAVGAASIKRNESPSGAVKISREASTSSSKSTASEEKKKKRNAFGSRK